MQRREFSISAATLAAVGLPALPSLAQAQAKPFQSGADYLTLDKPAPTEAGSMAEIRNTSITHSLNMTHLLRNEPRLKSG